MDRITLDREVFKALASDTRLDILKALDVRQKTVTELAKELNLNKATVFEHLEKLATVDLIQKLEDERKWVYWQLSWTGRRLLHPEKITLALALSSALASLVTALAAGFLWLRSNLTLPTASDLAGDGAPESGVAADEPMAMRAVEAPPAEPADTAVAHDPMLAAIAVTFALVFVLVLLFAARVWRRAKAADAVVAG